MTRTMRAYRLVAWQQTPELVETAVPAPGPGEALVRVAGNGLCHSDLVMPQMPGDLGEAIGWQVPFTLGHECAGWVDTLGADVSGVSEGDAVALLSPSSCGTCAFCVRGQDSACVSGLVGRGYGRDGGLAEYVLVRDAARDLLPLGSFDPLCAGPLTDAGATSFHAVRRVLSRLVEGSTAVVIGAGGLGAFAVQFLRACSPATVVAVDTSEHRRSVATELGAHHVIDGVSESTALEIRALTGELGADAVLDFVGIDATIAAGLAATRKWGAYGLVGAAGGTYRKPWYGTLPADADLFTFQGSTVADARDVVALAAAGRIKSLVDVFPLSRVREAYEAMEAGTLTGRAVVTPEG